MKRLVTLGGAIALALCACPGAKKVDGPPGAPSPSTSASTVGVAPAGPPLDFILDPVLRDPDWTPASEQLRGKRAVVLVLTSWDSMSLVLLRKLSPLLRTLPSDATCMLVAMQPLADRPIVSAFFDGEETPCLRAIGDPARGRLGDLAKVTVVPSTVVLRADGTLAGVAPGVVEADAVHEELEKAK
jgi:hypothetical protein